MQVWNYIQDSKHIVRISKEVMEPFLSGEQVRVIYYYKKDIPRLRNFVKAYDKSGGYLNLYGVPVAVVNCIEEGNKVLDKCKAEGSENRVYTYSNGHELLELELETMFDVNSIMSNILQLLLLREVPILQSKTERLEYEAKHKGANNVFFAYQKAIGTYEHRVFMEVAYAYQEKFKFALTTNLEAIDGLDSNMESSNAGIWLLKCKASKDLPCDNQKYLDTIDLSAFARHVKRNSVPPVFNLPKDGKEHPYTPDLGLSVVYFYYRETTEKLVRNMIKMMTDTLGQAAWFVAVDIEKYLVQHVNYNGETPSVAVQNTDERDPVQMEDPWSDDSVFEFVLDRLDKNPRQIFKPDDSHSEKTEMSEVESSSSSDVEENMENSEDQSADEEGRISEVESQDDHVAEAVFRARKIDMDLELVPALTDKTFPTTVQDKNLVMVLFYLPFDHRSMAFLRAYGEASRKLENETIKEPLASVNCHDWTDVCGKENITLYPTIRIFKAGSVFKDYDGMLDLHEVVKTVKIMAKENPQDLSTNDDIGHFIKPDTEVDVKIIGLFDKKHSSEIKAFKSVAKSLSDKIVFGINSDGKGKEIGKSKFGCTLPCMVILKANDTIQPFTVYPAKFEENLMKSFIYTAKLPSMPELTVQVFPTLYQQNKPFAIAFLNEHSESTKLREILSEIVKKQVFPDIIIAWMTCDSHQSFGCQVLSFYEPQFSTPALSFVVLHESKVFNMKVDTISPETVQGWIQDVSDGKIPVSRSLEKKEWTPKVEGYNFLEFIDRDEKRKTRISRSKSEADIMNREGIGFDENGNEVDSEYYENLNTDSKEDEDAKLDQETRMELFKSRLYHHAEGRKHGESVKTPKDEVPIMPVEGEESELDFMEHDITGLDMEDHKYKDDIPYVPHSTDKSTSKSQKSKHEEL
ncbi:hypothetical protein FSP39_025265 [Pinctada imbricata]|uniref:Thioredoxin domain-containing protein n=1 Tax=Pinctada imbricata TaxID=66713 RepID=A0AA89BXP3_PINIB|nr:hypothetical protein FSP39_025265 [Pinctada imbricata]